jgi:putative membrane protein
MANTPRFLDEPLPPAGQSGTAIIHAEPPVADHPGRPVLLEAEPDAPGELRGTWQPQDLAASSSSASNLPWIPLGIVVVLVSLAASSAIGVIIHLADHSVFLGAVFGLMLSLGAGLIAYGLIGEWRSYRKLKSVDRLRAALADNALSLEALRAVALGWLELVDATLPDATRAISDIRSVPTAIEIQAVLRNRAADPLQQAAEAIGRRAGLQAASLIAVSPHASWDGVIAGLRGLMVIRDVARLFGLRPGLTVTIVLVRKVAWTAAGVSGVELLSQGLADHALSTLPFARHIAASVPGSGIAALRLYRLANMAAAACCPVSR